MGNSASSMRGYLFKTLSPLLILILAIFIPTHQADADIGPKPSMDFEFEFESGQPLEIQDGILYECEQPDCSDAEPLEELGPQGFRCTADSCSSMAYGYSDYHRLLIRFSDGKERQSNVFKSDSFTSTFRVLVRENDLLVEKIRGRSNPFGMTLIALLLGSLITLLFGLALLILLVIMILRAGEEKADFNSSRWIFITLWVVMGILLVVATFFSPTIPITVAVEAVLGLIYAVVQKRSKVTTITMVILANMITLLPFWGVMNLIGGNYNILIVIVAEIFIWLVESLVLFLTQRKTIPIWEAALLSLVLNGSSFLIGFFLPL